MAEDNWYTQRENSDWRWPQKHDYPAMPSSMGDRPYDASNPLNAGYNPKRWETPSFWDTIAGMNPTNPQRWEQLKATFAGRMPQSGGNLPSMWQDLAGSDLAQFAKSDVQGVLSRLAGLLGGGDQGKAQYLSGYQSSPQQTPQIPSTVTNPPYARTMNNWQGQPPSVNMDALKELAGQLWGNRQVGTDLREYDPNADDPLARFR